MAIFEIQGPDGKTYEVEADSIEQAAQAFAPQGEQAGASESPPWGYVGTPGNYRPDVKGGGRLAAGARNALQGMTFGFGDEIVAGGTSLLPSRSYATELERERERLRQNKEDYPVLSTGSEIGGALGTSLGAWNAAGVGARGTTATGTLGRGIGMGATEGAVYGAGQGEGAEGRLTGGLMGLGLGAAMGGAAVPAAWALQKAGTGVGNIATGAFEGLTGRGSKIKAARAMQQTLERAGLSADEAARRVALATAEGQPEYRLMDALGQAGQRRASGIVRSGGNGATEIADFLRQRGIDAPDRMSGFVDDAFPPSAVSDMAGQWTDAVNAPRPDRPIVTAEDAKLALDRARGAVSDVTYEAARQNAGPVDVRGAVAAIDNRIGPMQGVDITGDSIDAKLARFRNRLISRNPASAKTGDMSVAPGGVDTTPTSVELSDFSRVFGVKQEVDDAIGAALQAGRKNEARELRRLLTALDEALEQSSDGYRFANDAHAKMSKPIDAIGEGAGMASRAGRYENTVPRFKQMSPEEQAGARVGYGDRLIQEIQGTAAEVPDVSRRFASTKRKAEAAAMAVDPGLLSRRTQRERDMIGTYQRALGGSRTADNLADIEDLGLLADAGRAVRDLSVGNVPGAASNAARAFSGKVGPMLTGQTEGTRNMIADALLSKNLDAALAAATAAGESDAAKRAIVAAMLRQTGHAQ